MAVHDHERKHSPNVVWEDHGVERSEHEAKTGHRAAVVWFTGLPASGKSTIARATERALFDTGRRVVRLDGDNVRHGLCGDLGFGEADRAENIRRVAEVARLFFDNGAIALCSFVSPYAADRAFARQLVPEGRFVEVHVSCSLEECRRRDPKGLYAKALAGEIRGMTGVDAPYQPPEHPEVVVQTDRQDLTTELTRVLEALRGHLTLGGAHRSAL